MYLNMLHYFFEKVLIIFSLFILLDSFLPATTVTSKVLSVYHESSRRGRLIRYMNIAGQGVPTVASKMHFDKSGQNIQLKFTPLLYRLRSYEVSEGNFVLSFSNKFTIGFSLLLLILQLIWIYTLKKKNTEYDYKDLISRIRWFSSGVVFIIIITVTFYSS